MPPKVEVSRTFERPMKAYDPCRPRPREYPDSSATTPTWPVPGFTFRQRRIDWAARPAAHLGRGGSRGSCRVRTALRRPSRVGQSGLGGWLQDPAEGGALADDLPEVLLGADLLLQLVGV